MKIFSKIIFYALAILVLSWFLPWLYRLMLPEAKSEPFMALSPVNGNWVSSVVGEDKSLIITEFDHNGAPLDGTLSKDDRDSLVPQMYYRNLMARKRMPDSIQGIATDLHTLHNAELILTSSPRDINKVMPEVYMIMESMPERADFEDPEEVWRWVPDGMEFIRIADGSVNSDRSLRFSRELNKLGFKQPLHDFSANVISRKQRDDGYLLVDAEGAVYQLKQAAGYPIVRKMELPEGVKADKVWVIEAMDPQHLGLMADTAGNAYFIENDCTVRPLAIGKIDPRKDRLTVMGNAWNIAFRMTDGEGSRWRALDTRTLRPIGTYDYMYPITTLGEVEGYLFPFELTFTSLNDSYAYPRISDISWNAAVLNLLLALCLALLGLRRKSNFYFYGAAVTCVCGLFAFIPLILTRDN